jgi:hypothetical protein
MSAESKARPNLFLLIAALLCLSLAGCCQPCIRPILQVEAHPAMRQIEVWPPNSPLAEYCLADRGRRDVLINLELYRASLESCRETIRIYNDAVKEQPK